MKFLVSQISFFLDQRDSRRNINALLKYLAFLGAMILGFSITFHVIMLYVEGREFSWISGFYWTLVVMSTLGFGDITFESDIGRAFSILVIISGVIFLLIMLPFTFIRYFYAPWLEAQMHSSSPREVPEGTTGHVIICNYDTVAQNLIKKLERQNIPYFVIESDSATATEMFEDRVSVIYGNTESVTTYEKMNVKNARLVIANLSDTENTNIILTVREAAPRVPIAAIAEFKDSIDILELSGADKVLPLKKLLGEKLANRINIGKDRAYVIGKVNDWLIVEFTVHETRYPGMTVAETDFRSNAGVNVIGVWNQGKLIQARSDTMLNDASVVVAVGTQEQVDALNKVLSAEESPKAGPVLIIGGGKVGRSAAIALKVSGKTVFMVEAKQELTELIGDIPDRLTIGNAADRHVLEKGGLNESSLVIVSTNQDAVNIYLSIYCRRLSPEIRIVSRITHDRNLAAIHRAGADFVLNYAYLGAESLMSVIQERESIVMGEDVEFSTVPIPQKLMGKSLQESNIGLASGVVVLAIHDGERSTINPELDHVLPVGGHLDVLGTADQLKAFNDVFN